MPVVAILFFQNEAKITPNQTFVIMNIFCKFEISTYNSLYSRGPTKLLGEGQKTPMAAILFFKIRPKIFPGTCL